MGDVITTAEGALTLIEGLVNNYAKPKVDPPSLAGELQVIKQIPASEMSTLKAYLNCKVIENDTETGKWSISLTLTVLTIVFSVFVGAFGQRDEWWTWALILAVGFGGLGKVAYHFGKKYEDEIIGRSNKKHFYEMCLLLLDTFQAEHSPEKYVSNS